MRDLNRKIQGVVDKAAENSLWRQRQCFNLIPSETTPSLLVKMCEISDPAGRYAEHRKMKNKELYFYQGIDFIREVEEEARGELCRYFGCPQVELRPISGQMANELVFKAVTRFLNRKEGQGSPVRRMHTVLNHDLTRGGHLSAQPMGSLFNYVETDPGTGKERVIHFPVRKDNPYRIDDSALEDLILTHKPELIIFGKSMFLYPEPVEEVARITEQCEPRPLLMYDMAHVLGLYGAFQAPFEEGADVVTGSTHKTFFGPQRGVVAGNLGPGHPWENVWLDLVNRAFPGSTSNHHLGTLVGLLLAAVEMNHFKDDYQEQVRRNAKAFAAALAGSGLEVEGDPSDGYTETHQVLLRVRQHGPGELIARRLEENNIITNYQALPDDTSFLESSGIRMGVQEMTRFGMKEEDFSPLAASMADVIQRNKTVKKEVAAYRQGFLEMKYCLRPAEAAPLGARLLASILPTSDHGKRFAENLVKAFT
jgi:glycine/serine hydroxymethyltransferase